MANFLTPALLPPSLRRLAAPSADPSTALESKPPWPAALTHLLLLVITCAAVAGAPRSIRAAGVCPGDEFWMISTRHITSDACRADLTAPDLLVSNLDPSCVFHPSDVATLASIMRQTPEMATVIYIHGNRFTEREAIRRAFYVYGKIAAERCTDKRIRFILWSWPSEQVGILLEDVRIKAERTDAQGLYLAWLLRELADLPSAPVLVGYSFGGRVATGALHALAGGALGCRRMPGPPLRGLGAKVCLVAAAIDRDWLEPCEYHGLATKNMHSLILMYNRRDAVLRRYWMIDLQTISRALGSVGPMRVGTRNDGTCLPVRLINCTVAVGRQHDELDYFSSTCDAGGAIAAAIENR